MVARECYVSLLKEVRLKETMIIEDLDVRDEKELIRGEPVEELVEVPIDPTKLMKMVSTLLSLLITSVLSPNFGHFRQWQCIFHPKCNNLIAAEVKKLLKAHFIRNVDYPKWLSNMVLVSKNNANVIPDAEDPNSWALSVDGSSHKEGSGAILILTTLEGESFKCALRFLFPASNNEAKYKALIAGLRLARDIGVDHLCVSSDSRLVVGQITDEFDAKEETMRSYRDIALSLTRLFNSFHIKHVPRSENSQADEMAQLALADQSNLNYGVRIKYLTHLVVSPTQQEVHLVQDEPIPWAQDIIPFLEQDILPENKQEVDKIRALSSNYLIIDGILYKRGFSHPFLKCLNADQATYVMREIHEEVCSNHSRGRSLAHKILRTGDFWPTLHQDATDFVLKCDKCQRFANIPHAPPTELITLSSPYPFAKWGIELVGPSPTGRGQVKFTVVAIDYFTKWVEAEPLAKITKRNTTKFIWQSIVCHFRILQAIVSDNDKQFDNAKFREFCAKLNIRTSFFSPGHLQANGQVEVTNCSLLKIIKTKMEATKGLWADELQMCSGPTE
ncbi:uncharacterized protein LOC114316305 [Camellia sinensis]|uniref:uncharacterized protein LOC114316305 n=1 Tax=Camellia sinensis TaxID=4442 RepID=UPI0010369B3B|nr:uncharacterized protein LOC114316305 [Camellia sinensis]